jgi:hypothetical protein
MPRAATQRSSSRFMSSAERSAEARAPVTEVLMKPSRESRLRWSSSGRFLTVLIHRIPDAAIKVATRRATTLSYAPPRGGDANRGTECAPG